MLLRTEQKAKTQHKAGSVQICTVSGFGKEGKFSSMTLIFSVKHEPLSAAGVQVPEERTGHGAAILGSWRMVALGDSVTRLPRCLQCAPPNLDCKRQLRASPCHVYLLWWHKGWRDLALPELSMAFQMQEDIFAVGLLTVAMRMTSEGHLTICDKLKCSPRMPLHVPF